MESNLVGFFGRVEDLADPKQLGRVRVRVINHHEQLEIEDLQWMTVGGSTSSANLAGVGSSPLGLLVGSLVYGLYFDGAARQVPVVMGTIPVDPDNGGDLHSLSNLARSQKGGSNTRGPDISGAPQYPYNKVITTPSGHVVELDDTPGSNRIVVRHSSGSSIAITNNGDVIVNSVNDSYHLVGGSSNTVIDQDSSTTAKSIKLIAQDNVTIEGKKSVNVSTSGSITLSSPKVSIK